MQPVLWDMNNNNNSNNNNNNNNNNDDNNNNFNKQITRIFITKPQLKSYLQSTFIREQKQSYI